MTQLPVKARASTGGDGAGGSSSSGNVVTTSKSENHLKMSHCMEGLKASELAMIRRLAGNDSMERVKTMKKLRKWLTSIAIRLPDTSVEDCRAVIEPNFIRVWKALFYCMWMADKPLPQEQLADELSRLVAIFKKKPVALLLFIEWFFRTVSREWPWIDRFRMDKFMMLIRRFLRSSLVQLKEEYKLRNEMLNPFLEIISMYIFNRFPTASVTKKTRAQLKVPEPQFAPLGFQMHFVDIFMEELAKVCGSDLTNKKILRILGPFINELMLNDDERLTGEIREKVFHYLLRQSDVAMDYEEGLQGSAEDGDDDDEMQSESDDDGDVEDEDDKGLAEMVMDGPAKGDAPLDPRAGAVDVVLPQLDVDYNDLARCLTEAGGKKDVRGKNRKLLYQIARSFQELVGGNYPLAIPKDNGSRRAIRKSELKTAAVRLVQLDQELMVDTGKPKKKKREAVSSVLVDNSASLNNSGQSSGGETSAYIDDTELFDHVDDNYMSYLEEMHKDDTTDSPGSKKKSKKKKKPQSLEVGTTPSPTQSSPSVLTNGFSQKKRKINSEGNLAPDMASPPKKEARSPSPDKSTASPPKKMSDSPTPVADADDDLNLSLKLRGKKKRKSLSNESSPVATSPEANGKFTPKKNSPNSPTRFKLGGDFFLTNSTMKTPALNRNILTPTSTPSSGIKKRVSFVMARNLEHPHADYVQSIRRSPAIPFDAEKQPGFGLLKSPATPVSKLKGYKIPLRAKAAEYFN